MVVLCRFAVRYCDCSEMGESAVTRVGARANLRGIGRGDCEHRLRYVGSGGCRAVCVRGISAEARAERFLERTSFLNSTRMSKGPGELQDVWMRF